MYYNTSLRTNKGSYYQFSGIYNIFTKHKQKSRVLMRDFYREGVMKLNALAASALLLLLAFVKLAMPYIPGLSAALRVPRGEAREAVRSAAVLGYIISGEDAPMQVWENSSGEDSPPAPVLRRDVDGFELEAMVAETLRSLPLEGIGQ